MKRPASSARTVPARTEILVEGVGFVADPSGVLICESHALLAVADLHLEKGSGFAARGVLLPPWDSAATLSRLEEAINRWDPRIIIALGDSFHDAAGADRMADDDRRTLRRLQTGRDWIWLAGNHDPARPAWGEGDFAKTFELGKLTFRHEPREGSAPGEIAGHLHPVARIIGKGGQLRRRCFVGDGRRLVLPAFGAYAGGLNLRDAAFDRIFSAPRTAHVLGRDAVYSIAAARCRPD